MEIDNIVSHRRHIRITREANFLKEVMTPFLLQFDKGQELINLLTNVKDGNNMHTARRRILKYTNITDQILTELITMAQMYNHPVIPASVHCVISSDPNDLWLDFNEILR